MSQKTILYATDYSPGSDEVLQIATTLARAEDAKLLIAHVTSLEEYPVGEHFDEPPRPNLEEIKRLNSVLPRDPNLAYEHHLLYGQPGSAELTKPADAILALAKRAAVDMIVMETHGRSGLAHLVMGSVAETVLRNAPCPVVTVKLPS